MTGEIIARHRRVPRWVWFTGTIVIAFALLAIVPRLIVRHQINAELKALRAGGYPVTYAEWDEWYPRPKGANAADVLNQVFMAYSGQNSDGLPVVSTAKLPPLGEPLPAEMKAKIDLYLAGNAKALELLHKGAAIRECRFPINLRQGPGVMLPHLAQMRQGARLLELEAISSVESGKPDEAGKSLEAMFGLGRSLREEPLLISQLVRMAIHSITSRTFEQVLSRSALPDEQLRQLAALAASEDDPRAYERAMVGECCEQNAMFEDRSVLVSSGIMSPGGPVQPRYYIYKLSGLLQREKLQSLKWMRGRFIADAKRPLPEAIKNQRAFEEEIQKAAKPRWFLGVPLSVRVVSPLLRAFDERAREAAYLRAIQAACGVERYRLAHGQLPENLNVLIPEFLKEVPPDPFDGQPMRYKRGEQAGYVIYSVGGDLKDDGGVDERRSDKGDIAVHVAR